MESVITKEEKAQILSMASYWDEVARRDDKSPLKFERIQVMDMLGERLLPIIKDYAKRQFITEAEIQAQFEKCNRTMNLAKDERGLYSNPTVHMCFTYWRDSVLANNYGIVNE